MFTKLVIENFKAFQSLEVVNLSSVNIFFGENNCGKSTLLESLFILTGLENPELFLRINHFRDYGGIWDASYFFHNCDVKNDIQLQAQGNILGFNRRAFIKYSIDDKLQLQNDREKIPDLMLSNRLRTKLIVNASIEDIRFSTSLIVKHEDKREKVQIKALNHNQPIHCMYLPPSASFQIILPIVEAVFQDKQESFIVDSLRMIDPRIKDFILIGTDILVDIGFNKRMPIQFLGDGMRKFFALIAAMYSSRDGVLLVDEIDNGLHYSVMPYFWNTVLKIAKKWNVQLYATTHNKDSLCGLENALSDNKNTAFQNTVSLYKLIHRDDDAMRILHYNYESFSTLLQNENEIR